MLSKLPALSSLNPNMTFWEWCANMTWTKYFFFIKSIFHVHSRTWVIMWGFHILLFFDGESFLLYLRCISSSSSATPPSAVFKEKWKKLTALAVSHPSTNQAGPCLASEIRRDRAYWGWYGRKWMLPPTIPYLYMCIYQGKCSIKQNGEAYSTWYSQAVSHPSTNKAGPCLASEIRRDRAYSGWYGRKRMLPPTIPYLYKWIYQGKCSIKQNEGDIFSEYRKEIILRTFNLLQSYCGVLIFCIFLDVE